MDNSDRIFISILFFFLLYRIMQVNDKMEAYDTEMISIRSHIAVEATEAK